MDKNPDKFDEKKPLGYPKSMSPQQWHRCLLISVSDKIV